jgi:hypothetical protein
MCSLRSVVLAQGLSLAVLGLAPALLPATGAAQDRRVSISFVPTVRAQIAIWIESADGARFATVRLTNAVAYRGIGNRPGALQMNSAFRWPYGRREGVLPVWAHRRLEATDVPFPRVIFAGRESEGNASSAGSFGEQINTRDDYFCLSFDTGDESLDAVSCASVFMSNKGRYLTPADVATGYSEPWEEPFAAASRMRELGLGSLYPPRQDLGDCAACLDHADVRRYVADTEAIMPELDAIAMATPQGDVPFGAVFAVPDEWPAGEYVAFVEVNTEGDYAPTWNATRHPTPESPSGSWDIWAVSNGYPYRGQPSVVYQVPFRLESSGGTWTASTPAGYGEIHGLDGELRAMDGTIRNDPGVSPGSGADRIRAGEGGVRVRVVVPTTDVCEQPIAPPECGRECDAGRPCANARLICGPESTCIDMCEIEVPPAMVGDLTLEPYPEQRRTHQWARMRFVVPASPRGIDRYEVRVGTAPIVDEASFTTARPAQAATIADEAVIVPVDRAEGEEIEVDLGGLAAQTRYWVGIRSFDAECDDSSEIAVAEIETTAIHFTTVSPCFVATAAYGSPLDARIGALRRMRDRYLMTNAVGRALVRAYYAIGPALAEVIAADEDRRALARAVLDPIVAVAERLTAGD